ncbi:sphingoid long-chain base transporter RSB1 [Clathrospora elynae]|uniref:Sphingoid long-chain base transporter RSB1 n=1 Tax=Clathrospora elynae TaxID=706981 RepID=A0A6A5SRY8_9PLEO|nr:sphingoid long-chain base transporter RSB1 [Clathrospora elynae]
MSTSGIEGWDLPCTHFSELCTLDGSYWGYQPSHSTNLAFAVLFGVSMVAFLVQGVFSKRWLGFTISMASGCAVEVIGYIGRVLAYDDVWSQDPFLIQIICLTIGPAFLAAGIYLCFSRIITTISPGNSRIKPLSYPRIFIPCDFISLVLQATGGALASIATTNHEDPKIGSNIMIAGLAFQVVTLLLFILLALDFAFRTYSRRGSPLSQTVDDHGHAKLRNPWPFKAFIVALSLSTLLIFTRCVFRVAELSQGWGGHLANTQKYFVGLEGAVIVAAVFLMNMCHPGFCFKEAKDARAFQPSSKTWYGKSKRCIVTEINMGESSIGLVRPEK